jgi:hypothetical protein
LRALPFLAFFAYDAMTIVTPFFNDLDESGALLFWITRLAIPAAILLAGGYFVRTVPPRSRFSVPALAASVVLLVLSPFVTACWALSLAGGICT